MRFSVPRFSSISRSIRGTTTAGETAPSTAPITAASIRETPRSRGAHSTYPRISKLAGTNDISTAGRPTFLRSDKSSDSPALIRMTISAIFRSSAEIPRICGSSRSRTNGPSRIPATIMPTIRGRRIFSQIAASDSPARRMSDRDVRIKSSLNAEKPTPSAQKMQKSSACQQRFRHTPRENFIPLSAIISPVFKKSQEVRDVITVRGWRVKGGFPRRLEKCLIRPCKRSRDWETYPIAALPLGD